MSTHAHSTRFLPALVLTLAIVALTPTRASACDCGKSGKSPTPHATTPAATDAPKTSETPRKSPLKGVITDILPDQSALMVKHEAIPGVMKAMTMMFAVDASVLTTVKKGDAITALMSRTAEGDWRLDEIKVIQPAS